MMSASISAARRDEAVSVERIGVAGAAAEDDDPALFEVADGAPADVGLGDLLHGDGGLHPHGHPQRLKRVGQREGSS